VSVVGDGEMNRFLNQTGEVLLEMGAILAVEFFHAVTQVDSRLTSNRKWVTNTSVNFYPSTTSKFLVDGTDLRYEIWDLTSHISHHTSEMSL
jgi:hypothetical protein